LERTPQRRQVVVSQILNRNDGGFRWCHYALIFALNSERLNPKFYPMLQGNLVFKKTAQRVRFLSDIILDTATFGMRCRLHYPCYHINVSTSAKVRFLQAPELIGGRLMAYDIPQLLKMSQAQLDELFTNSPVGNIPNGEGEGTAIVAPGTTYTKEIADSINHFAWQGKVFDAQKGVLKNKILPLGLNAIIAKVYKGPSWLDNKECIVLDYSETSVIAHWIRDEIRQIGPGMYLGKVYWDKKRLIDFVLKF
jgi:hypothetical protein